ncbi:MAG: PAS domain-containing protein [Rhodobacteraceae bacterium]|nr:PAS domain-containing protein [Paracoccaceae bacterium]
MKRVAQKTILSAMSAGPNIMFTGSLAEGYRTTWISPNVKEILGYSPTEFIDHPEFRTTKIHPDDIVPDSTVLEELRAKGHHASEFRFLIKDRTYKWFRRDLYLASYEHDRDPDSLIGYWTDISHQKMVEIDLEEAVSRFWDFAHAGADWFWEIDHKFRYENIQTFSENEYLKDRFSHNKGKTLWQILDIDIENDEHWLSHIADLKAHRPFRNFRYGVVGSDGARKVFSMSGRPVFAKDGTFTGYRGISTNITNVVEIEGINNRFFDAIDQLTVALALWDRDEKLLVCNEFFRTRSGLAGKKLRIGMKLEQWLATLLEHDVIPIPERLSPEDWISERLQEFRNPNGSLEIIRNQRWNSLSFNKLQDGSTLQVVSDIHDIKLGEHRFEIATKQAGVGVWETSSKTGQSVWSDSIYTLLGIPPRSIDPTLENFLNVIHPEDRDTVSRTITDAFESSTNYCLDFRIMKATGQDIWVRSCGVKENESGNETWFGSLVDIDQQKRSDIIKSEFISTMNHELRTPLTSIVGAIDLIRSGVLGEVNQRILNLLDIGKRNADSLLMLINDILDIEKLESGSITFNLNLESAIEILTEALNLNQQFASRKKSTLVLAPRRCDFEVLVDRNRMNQAFANLISNAVKFSPDGSIVELSCFSEDGWGTFSVKDFGPGISDEFKPRLFDRFAQEDSSNTRKAGGAGLGLAITKSLVEGQNGTIRFKSDPTTGTEFLISFPLQ